MARPKKNNLDYFPHDNSMRNDRKIKALRAKFDHKGYAVYNMLLEILCESELLILKWDETERELVSGDLTLVSDELTLVSEYLFKINLLSFVNGYVFCPQLDKRAEIVFGKRIKGLNSLRSENGIDVAETPVSDAETPVSGKKSTQSKVKHSIVKESKVKHKEREDFIDKIIDLFSKSFFNYSQIKYAITNRGKERACAGKILKLYKEKYPEAKSEEILKGLETYFDACCGINDNWLSDNMSLSTIINKFNEINKILTHGKKQQKGKGAINEPHYKSLDEN
ncbi:hypothetical protein ES708_05012 [subsurface metagenome]